MECIGVGLTLKNRPVGDQVFDEMRPVLDRKSDLVTPLGPPVVENGPSTIRNLGLGSIKDQAEAIGTAIYGTKQVRKSLALINNKSLRDPAKPKPKVKHTIGRPSKAKQNTSKASRNASLQSPGLKQTRLEDYAMLGRRMTNGNQASNSAGTPLVAEQGKQD